MNDNQPLILQLSADIRKMEKAFERASGVVDKQSSIMEKRASVAVRALEQRFEGLELSKPLRREFQRLGEDVGQGMARVSQGAQVALLAVSAVAIKLAADAGEIESAFDVAFKGSAASARSFSDTLAAKVGRDAVETREAMTRLQLVLTGTGVAAGQAAEMVKKLAEVGIDAGSLFNTTDAEAFQKIISGISGESEPLKAFGVVINDAALKAELLNLGFKGTTQEASEAAKSVARANLIIRGLAVAQGDATRTSGSAANQMRRTRAEFNAAARDLGEQLLPAFVKVTHASSDALKAFNDLPSGVQVAGLAILGFIAAGGPIAGLLANLGRVIKLANATRLAIAGVAAANVAAGATGAAGAVAGGAGATMVAGGAVAATAGIGVFEIVRGVRYQKTIKAVTEATDEAIASTLYSAQVQMQAAARSGPSGKAWLARMTRDVNTLTAEQARRAALSAPDGASASAPATVQTGFSLSGAQLTPGAGGGSGRSRRAAKDYRVSQVLEADTSRAVDVYENLSADWERIKRLIASESEDLISSGPLLDAIGDELLDAQQKAHDALKDGIAGGLEAGFRSGLPGVLDYLGQALQRRLLDSVADGLAGVLGGGGTGGKAGVIATAARFIFGGGRAGGGPVSPGHVYRINEAGQEFFAPTVPGRIANLSQAMAALKGAGGQGGAQVHVSQPMHFDLRGAVVTEDLLARMNQIGRQAAAQGAMAGAQIARRGLGAAQERARLLGTT